MAQGKAFSKTAVASAVLFAVLVFGAQLFNFYINSPNDPAGKAVAINIPDGQGFSLTVKSLEKEHIIRRPFLFRVYAKISGKDISVKAGRYRFSAAQSPAEILDALVSGKGRLNRLTVIEGWTVSEIAQAAEKAGFARAAVITALARDPHFARSLGLPGQSVEGYLFPDSYFFPYIESVEKSFTENGAASPEEEKAARNMLVTMVERFREKFTPKLRERAKSLGLSMHQTVILASVIEKETGDSREYPLVASVFYNRIEAGMRLQSDPTVIYGLAGFNGNLTKADLKTDHPYNTYTRKGLPAGPISNPGSGAIEGTLYPARTGYFYFVAKNDGTHRFSATLVEHNEAVARYQRHQ
ncbi:MAG: endolytic transglycosylase MltG [Deltaproteobacteria bacterium]|nr:endolytic transglycosylase MltG [Deltaproteobacteria bacterium]